MTCGCVKCRQLRLAIPVPEGCDPNDAFAVLDRQHLLTFVCSIEHGQLVIKSRGITVFIGAPNERGAMAAGASLGLELQIKLSASP